MTKKARRVTLRVVFSADKQVCETCVCLNSTSCPLPRDPHSSSHKQPCSEEMEEGVGEDEGEGQGGGDSDGDNGGNSYAMPNDP